VSNDNNIRYMDTTMVVMPMPGTNPATMPDKIPNIAAMEMLMELFSKKN
jgi:hypothetical protein